jgi:hypothetical protein
MATTQLTILQKNGMFSFLGLIKAQELKLDETFDPDPRPTIAVVKLDPREGQPMLKQFETGREALSKYGTLTERQLSAVQKCMSRDIERQTAREQAAPQVEIARIEIAFANAREKGLKYPRLRLAGLVFTPAKADSQNAGAVYVKTGETYLGKIAGGKLFKSRDCTPDAEASIIAAAADPEAAAVAYGKRFGQCAICARELTNQESIDRGIGPICAEKFGW